MLFKLLSAQYTTATSLIVLQILSNAAPIIIYYDCYKLTVHIVFTT